MRDHPIDAMQGSDTEQLFHDHTKRVVGAVEKVDLKLEMFKQETPKTFKSCVI